VTPTGSGGAQQQSAPEPRMPFGARSRQ
jgi:hypothetical protein